VDSEPFAHTQIRQCDAQLKAYLRKQGAHAPPLDRTEELVRICGGDLTSMDGIHIIGAMTMLSELGPDLRQLQDEDHFTSWLGLTGNENISGGRRVKGPKRKVKPCGRCLTPGGDRLLNSQSYLGARYRSYAGMRRSPPWP